MGRKAEELKSWRKSAQMGRKIEKLKSYDLRLLKWAGKLKS